MKICAACSQELPKDSFSKKQWQLKQQRRCKECIAANREVASVEVPAPNDAAIPPGAGGDGASDEDLFKQPPPREECPICFLPRPLNNAESQYQACCGKEICVGCIVAVFKADNRCLCPFCRTPEATSDGEAIERVKKRVDADDAIATRILAGYYSDGERGLRQDYRKANKLWLRAGEIGYSAAYFNLGNAYFSGRGVERDTKKANYYWELAAMRGNVLARHNLGVDEDEAGNKMRATKHWMIAAGAGYDKSLNQIRQGYLDGHATKDDFEKALRTHKEANDEMKSDQRDAAAAALGTRF